MRTNINSYITLMAIFGWAMTTVVCAEETNVVKSEVQPTRLISGDVAEHVDGLRARLAINSKERGPFGLFQKPGKEPIKTFVSPGTRVKKVYIPFQAVVDALPVAAVMASDKMFMVGSRLLQVGQVLPIVAENRTFKIQVEFVRADQIGFRNLADNQLAVKRLDLLPDGVSAGGGKMTPQGVTPTNGGSEEPLQVDLLLPPSAPDK